MNEVDRKRSSSRVLAILCGLYFAVQANAQELSLNVALDDGTTDPEVREVRLLVGSETEVRIDDELSIGVIPAILDDGMLMLSVRAYRPETVASSGVRDIRSTVFVRPDAVLNIRRDQRFGGIMIDQTPRVL